MNTNEYALVSRAARVVGVSENFIRGKISSGELKPVEIHGKAHVHVWTVYELGRNSKRHIESLRKPVEYPGGGHNAPEPAMPVQCSEPAQAAPKSTDAFALLFTRFQTLNVRVDRLVEDYGDGPIDCPTVVCSAVLNPGENPDTGDLSGDLVEAMLYRYSKEYTVEARVVPGGFVAFGCRFEDGVTVSIEKQPRPDEMWNGPKI